MVVSAVLTVCSLFFIFVRLEFCGVLRVLGWEGSGLYFVYWEMCVRG